MGDVTPVMFAIDLHIASPPLRSGATGLDFP